MRSSSSGVRVATADGGGGADGAVGGAVVVVGCALELRRASGCGHLPHVAKMLVAVDPPLQDVHERLRHVFAA
ncbi:MAG: hypothetical protein F4089_06260 [Gammaproteobacteria bacterium]|nr:hypothetical protein [Gammaproteobacteria bacterium]